MPLIYPPTSPTISGDVVTINAFLQSPARVARRVRDITEKRFIADVLFPTKVESQGGAIMYDQAESIYSDQDPDIVAPGAEYPRGTAGVTSPAIAIPSKYGRDIPITDESVKRLGIQPVNAALRKSTNRTIRTIDTLCLTAAAAAITQTQAASAAWNNAAADPFLDVMLAKSVADDLDEGYDVNELFVTVTLYARLVANAKVIAGLRRESANVVTESGEVERIADLTLRPVPAARMPAGVSAMVVDTTQFGALGYEDIPSPEYQGPATGVQTWVRRDPDANDRYLVRTRRTAVPIVLEPNAGVKLTGV
jgi:hypothetical protein